MLKPKLITVAAALMLSATIASAETFTHTNGGDSFTAGAGVSQTYDADRDVFAAGDVVTTRGRIAGDMHVAGMDVNVDATTGADLYAMGATVGIRADVAEDLTAMGYSVRLSTGSVVAGNARMIGRAITVDGSVIGALSAIGAEVTVNGTIDGDAWIVADDIRFGPDAQILGRLVYSTDTPLDIPETVITQDRVRYEEWEGNPALAEMRRTWEHAEMPILPTFISLFSAFLITLAFFIAIGAIFLALTPKTIAKMRREIAGRPGHIFLLGILGLSMLFGLIPITALTIVGLPFVPIALLLIFLAWTLGYVLAAYAIAVRIFLGIGGAENPSLLIRLTVLALAICIVTLLNFIPFVGWVINYSLVLLGIGAMTSALFNWLIGNPGYALDADMQPIKEG
jgi:hypothetical protein